MVLTKATSELFLGDGVRVGIGGEIRLPPGLSCSSQQTGTIQNFLPVVTLSGMQLPLHSTQPIFGIHGVRRMSKRWGMTSHEFSHYRNRILCRVSKTLGKGYFTLGKGFAECNTRQRTLGKGFFAECFFSDTRQRLCRVSKSTRQRKTLGKLRIEFF
jgi:hypothetical protein